MCIILHVMHLLCRWSEWKWPKEAKGVGWHILLHQPKYRWCRKCDHLTPKKVLSIIKEAESGWKVTFMNKWMKALDLVVNLISQNRLELQWWRWLSSCHGDDHMMRVMMTMVIMMMMIIILVTMMTMMIFIMVMTMVHLAISAIAVWISGWEAR